MAGMGLCNACPMGEGEHPPGKDPLGPQHNADMHGGQLPVRRVESAPNR